MKFYNWFLNAWSLILFQMVTVDWHYQETDSFLHCLPLHHVHGLVNNLIAVHFAGASVKMHKNFNAKALLEVKFMNF